jgi:hypothetical protein
MARLKKGIIDQLSGTIGPIVHATWRGIPYIRTKPTTSNRKRKKKSSNAQAATRIKFGLAVKLLRICVSSWSWASATKPLKRPA